MKNKPLRVTLYGERLKNVYPHASKWQVFKYKVALLTRKVLKVAFAILSLYIAAKLGGYFWPNEVYVKQSIDSSAEKFTQKVTDLKNDVVTKLAGCESGGLSEDDGILVFDSNKKASIGQLQFQKATVQHYYSVLYGKVITPKEAVLIALDTEKASTLARDIIFREGGSVGKDWYNCSKKLGLDAQVAIIKSLEK